MTLQRIHVPAYIYTRLHVVALWTLRRRVQPQLSPEPPEPKSNPKSPRLHSQVEVYLERRNRACGRGRSVYWGEPSLSGGSAYVEDLGEEDREQGAGLGLGLELGVGLKLRVGRNWDWIDIRFRRHVGYVSGLIDDSGFEASEETEPGRQKDASMRSRRGNLEVGSW
ncbi:hypothetical protein BDP27DRAFT_1401528 [Rhodocollybia butyracea]|uniref:Uncharacterized protein n=1 Tax=Rhodocollybia butyracea TaxID=206335 RepID=A0A9P5PZK1_9AGAR|nr:hypothetical protein BDP27DRAFT_1401528 [Rhodocollybia butyracea]